MVVSVMVLGDALALAVGVIFVVIQFCFAVMCVGLQLLLCHCSWCGGCCSY